MNHRLVSEAVRLRERRRLDNAGSHSQWIRYPGIAFRTVTASTSWLTKVAGFSIGLLECESCDTIAGAEMNQDAPVFVSCVAVTDFDSTFGLLRTVNDSVIEL